MVSNLGQYHEWDRLTSIIIGSALDSGDSPREEDCYDPTTLSTVKRGIYPKQELLGQQLEALAKTLESLSVKVYRPKNLLQVDQIFARDVGFVIQDMLVRSKMIEDRAIGMGRCKGFTARNKERNPSIRCTHRRRRCLIAGNKLYVGYSDEATISSLKTARTNEKALFGFKRFS